MVKDVDEKIVESSDREYESSWGNATIKTHYPEHIVHRVKTMCGQPPSILTGGLKTNFGYQKKPFTEHKVVERTAEIEPPQYWPSDEIRPQPLCSRCAKKADKLEAE
jgi:hypothetical protein